MKEFTTYLLNMDKEQLKPVPLLAYSVPVTNKRRKKTLEERFITSGGGLPTEGMRIDWATVDKVVEWVRSRIYELSLPTERTFVLFKYNIDDPVRHFVPGMSLACKEESTEIEAATVAVAEIS